MTEYIEKRLYALVQVGKYIGVDKMLEQIKEDEIRELFDYTRWFFVNTHGLSQEVEMKAAEFQSKGMILGYKYVKAIHLYCLEKVK